MRKKGQAAMEFLMTYGWAILAAIVVIGILGYYYFSSDILSPSAGIVSAPFYLNSWSVAQDLIQLELKNNGGETFDITNVTVNGCGYNDTGMEMTQAAINIIDVNCTPSLHSGTFSGDITVKYTKTGGTLEMTSKGSLKEKVSA